MTLVTTPDYDTIFRAMLSPADTIAELIAFADTLGTQPLPVFRNVTGQCAPSGSGIHLREPLRKLPSNLPFTQLPALRTANVPGAHPLTVRAGLLERLHAAHQFLPHPLGLTILDGWRARQPLEVMESWRPEMPPRLIDGRPYWVHASGGAVDVTVSWRGQPVSLGSPYLAVSPTAQMYAYEGAGGPMRALRRVFASAMLDAGFAPSGACWWHWEYGTPRWAAWYREDPRYWLVSRISGS